MTSRIPVDVSARVTGPTVSRSAWLTRPVPAPYSSRRVAGPRGTAAVMHPATAEARATLAGSASQEAALASKGSVVMAFGTIARAAAPFRPGSGRSGRPRRCQEDLRVR